MEGHDNPERPQWQQQEYARPMAAGPTPMQGTQTPMHAGPTPMHAGPTPMHAGPTPMHAGKVLSVLSPEPCTAWDTVYVGSMHVHARLIVSSSSSTCRTGPDGTCTYTSPSTPGTLSVLTGKLAMRIGFCLASRPLTLHVQDVPCRYGRLQDACIKGLQGCM